jgi:hypothetical protein
MGLSLHAQKNKTVKTEPPIQVPENVNSMFKSQFAVAENGQWKKTYKGNYVAQFTNASNQSQVVEYDASGNMLKNKTSYGTDALPKSVNEAVTLKYPDLKVTECVRIELAGIRPYYKLKLQSAESALKEILISEEGTVSE